MVELWRLSDQTSLGLGSRRVVLLQLTDIEYVVHIALQKFHCELQFECVGSNLLDYPEWSGVIWHQLALRCKRLSVEFLYADEYFISNCDLGLSSTLICALLHALFLEEHGLVRECAGGTLKRLPRGLVRTARRCISPSWGESRS